MKTVVCTKQNDSAYSDPSFDAGLHFKEKGINVLLLFGLFKEVNYSLYKCVLSSMIENFQLGRHSF